MKILLLEDSRDDALLVERALKQGLDSFELQKAAGRDEFLELLHNSPDLILSDFYLFDYTALQALNAVRALYPDLPFIVITGSVNEETAVACLKAGADDYILKDNLKRLVPSIQNVLEKARLIAEKNNAIEALKHSEAFLHNITDNMFDMVIIADRNGICVYAGKSHERILGYKAEELTGRSIFEMLHPEDVEQATAAMDKVVGQSSSETVEVRYRHAKGHYIWMESRGKIFLDQAGCSQGIIISSRDITEKKIAEQHLKASKEQLSLITDGLPVFIFQIDRQSRFVYVNKTYEEWYDLQREDIIGREVCDLLKMPFYEKIEARLKDAFSGKTVSFENTLIDRHGIPQIFKVNYYPHFSLSGEVTDVYGFIQNITSEVMTRDELESQRKLYRELIDSIDAAVWRADAESLKMTFISRKAEQILGYPAEMWTSDDNFWYDHIHPEDRDRTVEYCHSQIRLRNHFEIEYRMLASDGRVIWFKDMVRALINKDGKCELIGVLLDITESKRLFEELRESEIRFRSLFENSMDGLLLTAPDGAICAANPSACRMFGYEEEELCRVGSNALLDNSDPRLNEALKERSETGRITKELLLVRKDGVKFEGEVTSSLYINKLGEVNTSMVIRDMTEKKKDSAMLRMLSQAVEQSPVSIVITDVSGRIEYINPKFTGMTGFSEQEVLGKNPKILKSGFMTQEFYKNLWDKISSGNEFFGEILNRKKNGELFWELSRISCVKNEDNVITHYLAVKEDITQSKKMSEILTRSETFFRTVWENSMDAMRIISDTGLIVRVNDAFCRMFKKTREELEGHIFTVIHDSARQEDVDIVLGKMAARNIEPRQEMNLVLWNGEVLCVEISNSFLEIEGQPGMLLSIFSNITDRKDMEDKLTESESRFRSLIELSPDAVAIHSEGKVVYVNQAAVRIFGFDSYEELIGQPSFNYVHPDSHQAVRERISLMLREGGDVPFIEEKFLNKSGQAIDVEVASVPTVYRGKPAFQVIVRDIRERKKSEAALRLSEERFRTVFENSPLGICAIFESEIIMVNTACMKMFGYSAASELNGKTFLDFIAPTERDLREQSRIGRLNGEVTPTSFDGYGFKQDGTIFPYHAELSFLGLPEGEAIVAFLTDITEIKQKRDQIKTSLKEKETLLKEIHHRVKNNLQIISSLLSLQSEYVSDPQALELFNDSRNRVKSMAIIHERLYQSKDLSRIDFSDYINELGSYLFRTYTAAAIRFNISVDNIFLSIDTAIPCGLIINELISNALKYAFPERTDGTIKVIFRQQSGLNILEVSDNGVGFPPAIDFRNTNSLGLQLVNNLTEQLNGTIELKAHSGTTFVITFPEGEK